MEALLAFIGVMIYMEFREYRLRRQLRTVFMRVSSMKRGQKSLGALLDQVHTNQASQQIIISKMAETIQAQAEFIVKAQSDLATIVNEYEVNGVPLGYDRTGGKVPNHFEV